MRLIFTRLSPIIRSVPENVNVVLDYCVDSVVKIKNSRLSLLD